MTMKMEASEAAFHIIKEFEGLRLEAYQDSAGVWTIGYGHTTGVSPGDTISEDRAERLLEDDIEWAEDAVNRHVKVELTQAQFDALVSFVFNVGEPAFERSTLLKRLNKNRYGAVPSQLSRWDKTTIEEDGKEKKVQLAGLARRRAAEAQIWAQDGEDLQAKPAEIDDKSVSRSEEGRGAGLSALGAVGAAASEAAGTVQPLAGHSDIAMYVFIALTLVGVAFVIHGKIKSNQDND